MEGRSTKKWLGIIEDSGANSGQVRMFQLVDCSWAQLGDTINGKDELDHLGRSLAMSADGRTVVAGAHQWDKDEPGYAAVYVLEEP